MEGYLYKGGIPPLHDLDTRTYWWPVTHTHTARKYNTIFFFRSAFCFSSAVCCKFILNSFLSACTCAVVSCVTSIFFIINVS